MPRIPDPRTSRKGSAFKMQRGATQASGRASITPADVLQQGKMAPAPLPAERFRSGYHRADRQPAARASASEQNQRCPRLSLTVVLSYQGDAGVW